MMAPILYDAAKAIVLLIKGKDPLNEDPTQKGKEE